MSVIDFPINAGDRASRIAHLRDVLARKFQEPTIRQGAIFPTGLASIDAKEGGLRKGVMTEIVGPSSAGGLFIEAILSRLESEGSYAALIDAGRSFDPQGSESSALHRLLWVMCDHPRQAVKAADMLLRDGNLPLILLDFQTVSLREIQRIPASTWHRFQRIVEPGDTVLVVLSRQPVVEGAKVRIAMRERWKLTAMCEYRDEIIKRVTAQVFSRAEFSTIPNQQQFTG